MNRRSLARCVNAASLSAAAWLASGRAEASPYHFFDLRVSATGDFLGTYTTTQNGASGAPSSRGAVASAVSVDVDLVHSWQWLPSYGGVVLVARIGFDALRGNFVGSESTLYSPNVALGLGYVQPVNKYFQIELVPFMGIGADSLSFQGTGYDGLASKYGARGNFVFTINDAFQLVATVGYSWYFFSLPDLSGTSISARGATAGGGLGAAF